VPLLKLLQRERTNSARNTHSNLLAHCKGVDVKPPSVSGWVLSLASLACAVGASTASAAELELQGSRLVVSGTLDGSAIQEFNERLGSGTVRTVVFEDSFGGTAEAAGAFADAIRASGVQTEVRWRWHLECLTRACLPGETQNEQLIGYAIDGFGIYSMYDANGTELTDADLNACHGRTSVVLWDGKPQNIYHYVLTREYPYTIGCFMGTPQHLRQGPPPGSGPGRPGDFPGPNRPPPPPM